MWWHLLERLDESGQSGRGPVALGHGDENRVAAHPLTQVQHRRTVGLADDVIGFPVARFTTVVDPNGPLGNRGNHRSLVGVSLLAGSSGPQARRALQRECAGEDSGVDRLHADPFGPVATRSAHTATGERSSVNSLITRSRRGPGRVSWCGRIR